MATFESCGSLEGSPGAAGVNSFSKIRLAFDEALLYTISINNEESEHMSVIPEHPISKFQWNEGMGTVDISDLGKHPWGALAMAKGNWGFIVAGASRNIIFEMVAHADDGEGEIVSWTFKPFKFGDREKFTIIVFND